MITKLQFVYPERLGIEEESVRDTQISLRVELVLDFTGKLGEGLEGSRCIKLGWGWGEGDIGQRERM